MRAGELVDGRFEIDRPIGAGGMGQVYRALDWQTGEPVALKTLLRIRPEDQRRFAREAQTLASLRVPGVVRFVAAGATTDGLPYLAMEWLEGETLSERLARAPLSVGEVVTLARRVAEILGAVHQLGVVHRDLKPSNLLLLGGAIERVTVLDFGIVRLHAAAEQTLTNTGVLLGTPGYMAPEQARGQREIDARADVFSLGCVLYRCLAGRAPFQGAGLLAALAKVTLEEPPPIETLVDGLPEALSALLGQMLAKAPADRPRDGSAVAAELSSIALLPGGARPATLPPSTGRRAPLSASERKVLCLVLARGADETGARRAASAPETEDRAHVTALRGVAARHQAELTLLEGRTPLLTLTGTGTPTDLSARAARCAIELQALLGGAPVALVTGRAEIADRLPLGEVIDRAAQLLPQHGRALTPPGVRVDEVTAALLGGRFASIERNGELYVLAPVEEPTGPTSLLGQATPFVGRDREIAMLEAELDHCLDEPAPSFVLLTGAAGMGKSRLRHELLQRVKARGEAVEVWTGQADPMTAGSAFVLLSSALRRTFGIEAGEPREARWAKVRARVEQHAGLDARRVAAFLGEIVGTPFPDDDDIQLRAARRSPILMSDHIRIAWEEFVRAESAARPLVLVLEDLHWGDRPTVSLVDHALRSLKDRAFFVLALARPEVEAEFPGLWADRRGQSLRLTALPRRASERLARQTLGEGASDALVTALLERAEGNPFFLEELLRAARADAAAPLPETVLAMVQARLEALAPAARRVLRAASVFGQSFQQRGVEALVGEAPVATELLELTRREFIVRQTARHHASDHDDDDVAYRFRHALVREAAYGMLTQRDKRLGHALAGEWLERADGADPLALAEHFEQGGEPARAATAYLRAAEQALRGSDLEAAIARAERGMACAPDAETAGALRAVQAEAYVWRGELELAEERGAEAIERLPEGSTRWFAAMTHLVVITGKLGVVERLSRRVAMARDAAVLEGARDARNICLSECTIVMTIHGDIACSDAMMELIERSLDPAALDAEAIARLHMARAFRAGGLERALRHFEAALAALEKAGDRRNVCTARMNIACVYAELGALPRAEVLLREALSTAEQLQLHELGAFIMQNLGMVLAHAGRLDEAQRFEAAALEAALRIASPRLLGGTYAYLARIAALAGDFPTAERHARTAIDILQPVRPLLPIAHAMLARALLGLGRIDEALAEARAGLAALMERSVVEEGEALVRLAHVEALAASGAADEAEAALAAARDALLARARAITDPHLRESFLRNVPEHARTIDLALRRPERRAG